MKQFFLTILIVLTLSCNEGTNSSSRNTSDNLNTYIQPSASICDASITLSQGFLCAIRPSRINPLANDTFGSTGADAILGFGHHVIAFPNNNFNPQNVKFHFGGSFGRPYNQSSDTFSAQAYLEASLSTGSIVVMPAYHNRFTVNGSTECGANTNLDNCAELVRDEKIRGTDLSSVVTVSRADSIEQRIIDIFNFFQTQGFSFPGNIVQNNTLSWSEASYSGHSQGSGHALFIGKNFGAQSICVIGGVHDVADSIPSIPAENVADWILAPSSMTPVSNIKGFLTNEDASFSLFTSTLNFLNISFTARSNPPYVDHLGNSVDGHAAAISDPQFTTDWQSICF